MTLKSIQKFIKLKVHKLENPTVSNSNEWVERRRREWDEHVIKMDAERLVKISRDNIPAGIISGRPKRRWSDLIPGSNRRNRI